MRTRRPGAVRVVMAEMEQARVVRRVEPVPRGHADQGKPARRQALPHQVAEEGFVVFDVLEDVEEQEDVEAARRPRAREGDQDERTSESVRSTNAAALTAARTRR